MDHCADPTEFREYWKRNYGPTTAVYRFNADRPERVEHLDRDFLSFLTAWNHAAEPGRTAYDAEYLLVTAIKRWRQGHQARFSVRDKASQRSTGSRQGLQAFGSTR